MARETAVTCESREAQIALHVEGDLEPAERARLEAHLAGCARCRDFAEALRRSQASLKELADGELDPAALAEVRHRVRRSLDRPRRSFLPAWALAAAAVVAVTALMLTRRPAPVVPPPLPAMAIERTAAPTATAVTSVAPPAAVSDDRAPVPSAPRVAARRSAPSRRPTMTVEPPLPLAPDGAAREIPPPTVVKLTTSDPDVVIYWVDDSNGGQS